MESGGLWWDEIGWDGVGWVGGLVELAAMCSGIEIDPEAGMMITPPWFMQTPPEASATPRVNDESKALLKNERNGRHPKDGDDHPCDVMSDM